MEAIDIILNGFYNARLNNQQEIRLPYTLPDKKTIKEGYDGNPYDSRQSAWYIYNRAVQLGRDIPCHLETDNDFLERLKQEEYLVGNDAEVGAIACFPSPFSDEKRRVHFAFVEYLNSDGSFIVSEMPNPKILNWRLIQAQEVNTFIYLKNVSEA